MTALKWENYPPRLREWRIEQAMKNGEIVPYFQPKVDLKTAQICGAEALVRWAHPTEGVLAPQAFLPWLEEESKIDLYMFEQVCSKLEQWIRRGQPAVPISVNFSRAQFRRPNPLDAYFGIRERYRIPPQYLEIELLESACGELPEQMREMCEALHKTHIRVAIDDFGSGSSSLGLLRELSIDTLKLDRCFLQNGSGRKEGAQEAERGARILESVIDMACKLKLQVVAEGVETSRQVKLLKSLGCDMAQGFYFYRPMTADAFEAVLAEQKKKMIVYIPQNYQRA